jgi:hypothetical protein
MSEQVNDQTRRQINHLRVMVKSIKRKHKGKNARYPVEVKALAGRILESEEIPISKLEREVGLGQGSIRLWKPLFTKDEGDKVGFTRVRVKETAAGGVEAGKSRHQSYDIELPGGLVIRKVKLSDMASIISELGESRK